MLVWNRRASRPRRSRRFVSDLVGSPARLEDRRVPAAVLPAGYTDTVLASGLALPQSLTVAPDGRLFVSQRDGTIRIIKDGALLSEPFARLTVDSDPPQGLMGLAFDPAFARNGYVYAYYVSPQGGSHNRISRLTADGDRMVPGSERVLFDFETYRIPPGVPAHNGGAIAFGPDGKLYVTTGDMMNERNSQSLRNTHGKVLRVNPDGTIPRDNPFFRRARGNARAIWAMGFRNPFTMAFSPRTGQLVANDVGGGAWEEVNLVRKGGDYGWPDVEGPRPNRKYEAPIYAYAHEEDGVRVDAAIIGGGFYEPEAGTAPEEYRGQYFFSDYARGWIRRLDLGTRRVQTFASGLGPGIVDLDIDGQGRIYYVGINDGSIHMIQYSPLSAPVLLRPVADQIVPAGATARFEVSPLGSAPFSYQWQRDGVDIPGATGPQLLVVCDDTVDGTSYRVVVRNTFGETASNPAVLRVSRDRPPTAIVARPRDGDRVRVGSRLRFQGTSYDAEAGGELPASSFTWHVDVLHDSHVHPDAYVVRGKRSGTIRVPRHDDPGRFGLRVRLVVTDSAGQKDEAVRDVWTRG
jgi:glucose/arabinose dehydrogenase